MFRFTCFVLCVAGINSHNPEVTIGQGKLSGKIMTAINGKNIYAFQGIPYGKPPINELRFKTPQPADGWDGVKEATSDDITCVQHLVHSTGQEDCLYLNVYTGKLPDKSVNKLKPTMVFIHGGAFSTGSGSSSLYGPKFLLTENIVLVTINYRLGILGGFSVDNATLGVTGNPGIKDQLLALKWVKQNIRRFGGDPDNVTLFGQSAGSKSVHLHLMSPKSSGYFSKAIGHSGVSIVDFINRKDRNNGLQLAEFLGIQTTDLSAMLSALQALPVSSIITAGLALEDRIKHFHAPTIEIESDDAFITQNPIDLIKSGQYNQVPYVTGATNAEGLMFQLANRAATGENVTIENFLGVIPMDLNIDPNTTKLLSKRIRRFYYGDKKPTPTNITPTVNLLSDYNYIFPAYRAAVEQAKVSKKPIYFYFFTADTKLNVLKHEDATTSKFPGVSHSEDLCYIFDNHYTTDLAVNGTLEYDAIKRMVKLWTHFAKFSNPTPDASAGVIWKPVSAKQFRYLNFDSKKSNMKNGIPMKQRLRFWWKIYEKYYVGKKY